MTHDYTAPFRIPFSGFKSTIHGLMIDHLIDMNPSGVIPRFELEPTYAKIWLHELARETGYDLVFQRVEAGNRIYATMSLSQIEALYADMTEVDLEKWKTMVANPKRNPFMFGTSGLIPHPVIFHPRCSLDVEDWGPVATWEQGKHDYLFDFRVWPQIDEAVLANRAFERFSNIPGVAMIENLHGLQDMVDMALEQDRDRDADPVNESIDECDPGM